MNRRDLIQKVLQGGTVLVVIPSVLTSCSKDPVTILTLTTTATSLITQTTATSGGSITNDGGETIISRGVCWSTNITPSIADNKTIDGAGAGSFSSKITGLIGGITYFVRAYAINASGTGYGMAMSFTTLPATVPVLSTANITSITQTSATCGGTITSDGAASITARGVCWSTSTNPTTAYNKTTDGTGIGAFISSITGLILSTTYYVRAYATNSLGTAYGSERSFITNPGSTITIDLSLPENLSLNTAGGSKIVQNILIINTGTKIVALSAICTHQGCAVGYYSGAGDIECPCHGSVFSTTGSVIKGPASSPLHSYSISKLGNILTISLL